MTRVHGTTVALDGAGILIRGPSGSGKSDLALRLIDAGARLVADDQTELWRRDDAVMARCPATIAGQIEVRGLGILRFPHLAEAPLRLVVDLIAPDAVERLPEPQFCEYLQCSIPLLEMAPFEISAALKLRLAVDGLVNRLHTPIVVAP
jgi:HPr kinase/phosphorylase